MKKYILILLSVSCFGQFNPVQWYEFGAKRVIGYNTYIGGVGSVINTKTLLAAKLTNYPSGTAFSVNSIRNFEVVGNDVRCYIINDYSLGLDAFRNTQRTASSPTYYHDTGGKCKEIKRSAFYGSRNTKQHYFPSVVTIGTHIFYHANYSDYDVADKIIYLPNCTYIGSPSVVNTAMFGNTAITQKMYANTFLQTNNSGGVDATVQDGITNRGLQVVWVLSQTPPNLINNLSATLTTTTTTQLNFTPPTGSANAIDFYEVWINGFPYQEISGSGGIVTGLTSGTNYKIEVKPVDVFYNKSTSNIINVSTL